MTALDIIVLLLLGGGAFAGWRRGFVQEMLSLAAWLAGVVAVKALHGPATAALADPVGTRTGAAVLAFLLTFGIAFFAVRILAGRVGGATRRAKIVGPIDRLLGLGFGVLKGLIGATLLFLAANLVSQTMYGATARPDWLVASRTYPLLNATSRALVDFVDRRRNAPPPSDAELNR